MAGKENDWPSCRQLQDLMTDKDFNMVKELCATGVLGITKRLGSDPERGLPDPVPDFDRRVEVYGRNTVAERASKSYLDFLLAALKEHLILLLLFIGTVELVVKLCYETEEDRKEGHGRKDAWIEPLAIYITVAIIVNVAASMDYNRERLFAHLSQQVAASNLRFVIRGGKQVQLTDEELVVGDILTFNSHLAAMIPADGLLLAGEGVKMDESALTGEPEPMVKDAHKPFIVSGTTVTSGQGKMLIIAVGEFSVSGKIKKAVYEDSGEEKPSPLFEKLDKMASQLGRGGTAVAFVVFVTACVQGFAVQRPPAPATHVIGYLLLAFGILAVAVPEGLPLALTISLAISSNKMSKENNLVKTLDSCETMGSVTTICTDKTGTLTANRMTVQAAYIGAVLFKADDVNPIGPRVKGDTRLTASVKDLTSNLIGVCTMDESQVLPGETNGEPKFLGNPTECAMLRFIDTAGYSYATIRQETPGRNAATRDKGAARAFSSARKMMSWAVPRVDGGFRIFAKGASEIILDRVESAIGPKGEVKKVSEADKKKINDEVIAPFAKLAFRTIGLAYKDVDHMPDDATHPTIKNSDGSQAFMCETGLILVGVLGIADPLRLEVPGAIQQCYHAGIDVRMVTGDNLVTAIAIARKAGILKEDLHFSADGEVKPYRAMEGKTFRHHVYRSDPLKPDAEPEFLQDKFDEIWPFLRVMARSSPEDKLTLAMGLQQSRLFADESKCRRILRDDKIAIFPDHQVIAMTGDGTNDAPALKRADVGFAMGIAGTQIAKDAANIILMDDNFASIVTAAKWGRNVYDSIQKFLQFQLTVNIAILVLSLLVSFAGKDPPLKLLHLLWLNMIMDSLASVAIANEPPNEAQLHRPPVNRSGSIFTDQMWFNMLGQAFYQVFVTVVLLFQPWYLPDMPPSENGTSQPDPFTGPGSRHYTIIFNTFVLFQLFNQFNCRFLLGEWNILSGLTGNRMFVVVTLIEFICQFIMAQFSGTVLQIHPKGLTIKQWLLCLGLGAGPLLWQPCLNVCKILVDRAALWLRSVRTKKAKADSATTLGRSSLISGRMSVRDKE